MNYTKGKWKLGSLNDDPFARSVLSIYQEDGRRIAEISREAFLSMEEAEANAQLIASAPELDNALRLILWDLNNLRKVSDLTIKVANEALSKAKGKDD